MQPVTRAYGTRAYETWKQRFRDGDEKGMRDLSDCAGPSGLGSLGRALTVGSFRELLERLAFLSVMNKRLDLLFRGVDEAYAPQPTLSRHDWQPPKDGLRKVSLQGPERAYYWSTLATLEGPVRDVLEEFGLPRWRHIYCRPPAVWAVIQHYELWPTPWLDFTASPRVACSFALSVPAERRVGYLYVAGVPQVRADLMELPGHDDPERRQETVAVRLSSVCPPSAWRPHLQEGVLVGHYPLDPKQLYDPVVHDASNLILAVFRLEDRGGEGGFWTTDFPPHSLNSLLPNPEADPLLHRLREAVEYRAGSSGRVIPVT